MTAKKKTEPQVRVVTTLRTKGGGWKTAGDIVKASQVPDLEWRLRAGIVVPAAEEPKED